MAHHGPPDVNELAFRIVAVATTEKQDMSEVAEPEPTYVTSGREGGKARAAALTPEERSASARRAALARWAQP